MKERVFSFLLAVCTALSLTMTSCAAQEGPEEDANPSPVSALSQELALHGHSGRRLVCG